MKYFCNPININYRYQFHGKTPERDSAICREAADPSMICFKGRYYIFASMTLGVWVSDDLVSWENHRLPDALPLYDYAPDVRVLGEYVYFCASKSGEICHRYRTRDILNGPYEKIEGSFDYWDPNLFVDDDDRVYFYWGCSNVDPIWGVELDPATMNPIGGKVGLLKGHPDIYGYERTGEDNSGSRMPYIEGAWMDKFQGRYYLQYAFAGTEFNTYGDGVYVSSNPLGPFEPAKNNPYSYKPGGFIPGAGHGSTMKLGDELWHTSTMRISINHDFERRVGIWHAGLDEDGELFCDQRFGDWPIAVADKGESVEPWQEPVWMLLSNNKPVRASSWEKGKEPEQITVENVRSWWRPASSDTSEWIELDLEKVMDVRGIQINFEDDCIEIAVPGQIRGSVQARYIEEAELKTQYLLEGSEDGVNYFVIEDKREADTDLCHDFLLREEGIQVRYIRLSQMRVPYGQRPCVSGIRVFGRSQGNLPDQAQYSVERLGDLDLQVRIDNFRKGQGYCIMWGNAPDKLYHSYLTYSHSQKIGGIVKGKSYYFKVDAVNECGITEGKLSFVK